MGFNVGLVHHVDPVKITQVVPGWGIWIMTGSYSIDIEFFHQFNILYHTLHRHDVPCGRVHLMPVNPFDEYGFSVDQQLGVLYFHVPEAHLPGNEFRFLPGTGIGQR